VLGISRDVVVNAQKSETHRAPRLTIEQVQMGCRAPVEKVEGAQRDDGSGIDIAVMPDQ